MSPPPPTMPPSPVPRSPLPPPPATQPRPDPATTPEPAGRDAARLRALPQVARLLEHDDARAPIASSSRPAMTEALRRALAEARDALRRDQARPVPDAPALIRRAAETLGADARGGLGPVINATGIVLHTNLGRAPLSPEAAEAAAAAAANYTALEFDLATGGRGQRLGAIEALLAEVTGAAAAVAVNNGAAAVLLALSAHAANGGEVIVSRGELVEIGGGFRIPDVIAQGGARLVEVGTTNRTRIDDYARAIGPATRMLLKVHRSNFRIVGFTEEASLADLAALARERGLVSMFDLGGGAIHDPLPGGAFAQAGETTVAQAIASGCDLVAFSGDKLLGGPQSGIVAGRADAVAPLRRHPLMRALRLDKMTLAALDATLRLHRGDGRDARLRIPALRIMAQTLPVLEARAERLRAMLAVGDGAGAPVDAAVEPSEAEAGGGTLPGLRLPSRAVSVAVGALGTDALLAALRAGPVPVIGRAASGRVLLDMFTVADDALDVVARAIGAIAANAARAAAANAAHANAAHAPGPANRTP